MVDWLQLSQNSGYGKTDITITASSYSEVVDRVTSLLVSGQTLSRTVSISQGEIPSFDVVPLSVSIPGTGGTATFTVSGSAGWSASTVSSWLTISPSSGVANTSTTVTLTASRNDAYYERTGTVKVTNGYETKLVSVQQYGTSQTFKLYYKSANGYAITPDYGYEFGAELISNEYVNGQGIMTFSSPPTMIEYAFNNKPLTEITIPSSVTYIGEQAFSYSQLRTVTIPHSVTDIGVYAFGSIHTLESITIPNSVRRIATYSFPYCENLTTFNFEAGSQLTELGYCPDPNTYGSGSVFSFCDSLSGITIPEGVTELGPSMFTRCYGLQYVNLPSTLRSIGDQAFFFTSALTDIHCYAVTAPTVTEGTYGTFFGCGYNNGRRGVIHYPVSSNYSSWTATTPSYLNTYGWTLVGDL